MINKSILASALSALIIMASALTAPADAITVTYPAGGEALKVGTTSPITWTTEGVIATVNIEYSKDDFVSDINAITTCDNTDSYAWTIPDDITPDFIVKVRVSSSASPAISSTSVAFKIRADISLITPTNNARWVTNEYHYITYVVTGTVPTVTIYYSCSETFESGIQLIISGTANTGYYNWRVPDRPIELQLGPLDKSKVRICDSRDLTAYGQSPNPFKIDYYYITFNVKDSVTNHDMTAMTYMDPIRGLTLYPFSSPRAVGYPYGTNYQSILAKPTYAEVSVENWAADRDKIFYLKMDSSVVHNWQTPVTFNYEPSDNSLLATAWFTMDGLIPEIITEEGTIVLSNVRIDIYDEGANLVKQLESDSVDVNTGRFTILWANTNLMPGTTYFAKVTITYNGTDYHSALTFEINLDAEGPTGGGTTHTWEVKGNVNYNYYTDKLETTSWLTYDGLIIAAPDSVNITITDYANTLTHTLTSATPDTWGVFRTSWTNPGLDSYQTYSAYIAITYASTTYRGIVTFDLHGYDGIQAGSSGGSTTTDNRGLCGYLGIEPLLFILLLIGLRRLKAVRPVRG